jgi:hypothetical protein
VVRKAGVLAIALALATTSVAVAATGGERIEPFAADGSTAAGWSVTSGTQGSCFAGSIATRRADAYRCFSGANQIGDPCFVSPVARDLVMCVPRPWARRAIRIHLTKPLPSPGSGTANAWAVDLANGGHCSLSTGANSISRGRVVGWYCTNGALAQRLHPAATWWAWYQARNDAAWRRVAIATVYR